MGSTVGCFQMFEFAISWNAHVMMGGGALHDGMMAG
jgi:hypothetical protein